MSQHLAVMVVDEKQKEKSVVMDVAILVYGNNREGEQQTIVQRQRLKKQLDETLKVKDKMIPVGGIRVKGLYNSLISIITQFLCDNLCTGAVF